MRDTDLFQLALGLTSPWMVMRSEFTVGDGQLDLYVDFPSGSRFACSECGGGGCKVHDTKSETWRHLDFFQHCTFLHARTPRVICPTCGVHKVAVPWARGGSGFTLLFEAYVLALAKAMPIANVAERMGEHDTRLCASATTMFGRRLRNRICPSCGRSRRMRLRRGAAMIISACSLIWSAARSST
jgi:transposase